MNFRDRWEENEDGEKFLFTVEMQRRLSQAGLPVEPASLERLETSPGRPARSPERSEDGETSYEGQTAGDEQSAPEGERPPSRPAPQREAEIAGPETIQIDPMTGKYIGQVKWYNAKKGYGFILRGGGEEIFFHKSGTVGEMEEFDDGQWILYDVEETNKGPEATDVEPFSGESETG
ncbi:MAG: cold shock domain-containing protein [Chloroflexota bacterium]|jgi:cold shock protein